MKYIGLLGAAFLIVFGTPAFASTPCSSFTNFANLQAAGSCTAGPNGDVTFDGFQTSASPTVWSQIGITALASNGVAADPGLYGLIFNTTQLTTPFVSFLYRAHCDSTCLFNDTFDRVQGNGGSGEFVIAGQTDFFTGGQTSFAPTFAYTNSVQSYGSYTVTSVANMAASTYEMDVNIVPSSWQDPASTTCPAN